MGKVNFYVLWSLREAPRQFISKSNRLCYQVRLPLPLPKELVVFSLGDWKSFSSETTISVEVSINQDLKPQKIGTLSSQARCLIWEGDWRLDLLTETMEKAKKGMYGKIVLTVCGEVKASFTSSTPLSRKRLASDCLRGQQEDVFSRIHHCEGSQVKTPNSSASEKHVTYADLKCSRGSTVGSPLPKKQCVWPTDKTPRRTVIGKRGQLTWSSEELGSSQDSTCVYSSRKRKMSLGTEMLSDEDMTILKLKKKYRAVCPSKRWCQTMCLSDPETAILIGGEASGHSRCRDSIWKLEIENNFWFPMDSSTSGPVPPCSRGHSATYDPESKAIYVYGGLTEGQRYGDVYILNTLTWKWKLIAAKGSVPTLANHSATIYRKELFVFGGVQPSRAPGGKTCSNTLYIFNPEFELWYQPIVEGDRPLPRFGHSTILLSNKLMIFGGRKTAAYLNDLHILDLGFMEYTAVKYENMPPLPRGFHAAVPVSDNRMVISGGCSAIGALQDLHVFYLETSSWSSIACPALCSKPRAGHSLLLLKANDKEEIPGQVRCTVLVFGGSDCAGTFYDDTAECTVEIPGSKVWTSRESYEGKLNVPRMH
ncbi:kelch domain-containing protein 2 isoform X1 [Anguilla anguilla]|uniref:kelch domain-containing protein 2 isoform X1 n=1 Tax=Anguilla anguilla TaxID=7936 RepID=UPI0015B1DD46|nr:kelch domain-containing protein 2 isoform X1 [Anguilla anguilla]